MKILILGGTKFIGPHVVKRLHQAGHEIVLFHRGETHYPFSFSVPNIRGDRANLLAVKKQFAELSPDIVIDMIAYSEADAKQLIEVFRGQVSRIVIISSCDVYRAYDRLRQVFTDTIVPTPLAEQAELRKNFYPYREFLQDTQSWQYTYEKILVENTILTCPEIKSTILRLPMVYGPGDYSRIYPYLKRMDDNRPILLDEKKAKWRTCRGYVEDVAHAIVLAALDTSCDNHIYNVGEKYAYSEMEWIKLIEKVTGVNNEIVTMPSDKLPAHLIENLAWEQDLAIDTSLIRHELNYKELNLVEDAIKKSVDWLRTHKPQQMDKNAFNCISSDLNLTQLE